MKRMLIFAFAASVGAQIAAAPPSPEARIPFANHGGIDDWRADGDEAIWLKGNHKQWYHATLLGRCIDLDTALTIGFDTGPVGDFDKFSKIIVHGRPCPVTSLVKSDPPPRKAHKPKP